MADSILKAAENQVYFSGAVFRCLLDSLARPGKLNSLPFPRYAGKPPFLPSDKNREVNIYAAGALLSLLDGETNFITASVGQWLVAEHAVSRWFSLRTAARYATPATATFAFFCEGGSRGLLAELRIGTPLEPETSTTVFFCVEELANSPVEGKSMLALELTGPGLEKPTSLYIAGFDREEIPLIQATRNAYPLGIDVMLVDAAGNCAGLPRTTRLKEL